MMVPQNWDDKQFGDAWSGVVRILVRFEDGAILGHTLDLPSRKIIVRNANSDPGMNDLVVINAKVLQVSPLSICEVGLHSMAISMPPVEERHFDAVVELCSGLGVFSSMAPKVSMHPIIGIDQNGKWEKLFLGTHPNAQFIQGDIDDLEITKKLLSQGVIHPTIVAGVSCQPHSQAGDQRGMNDPRSKSLPAALQCIWLTQSPLAIVECVPEIGQNADAQLLIQAFCKATGYVITQQVINLQNCFPTRRSRWFAVISSQMIGPIYIPDLPLHPCREKISSIMPYPLSLPRDEMEQLQLALYELSKYHEFGSGGINQQMINFQKQLPTILHSIANQLYPCRCGCHPGFSLARLQRKGLFGVLIPLDSHITHANIIMQHCRFMHPDEVFLLHGGVIPQQWGEDLRLADAGLGQSVSPIQGLWVFAHVKKALQGFLQQNQIDPEAILHDYMEEVFRAKDLVFPVHPTRAAEPVMPSTGQTIVRDCGSDTCIRFVASASATVEQFQKAQLALEFFHNPAIGDPGFEGVTDDDGNPTNPQAPLGICKTLAINYRHGFNQDHDTNLHCPCHEWTESVTTNHETQLEISDTVPFSVSDEVELPCEVVHAQGKAFLDFRIPSVANVEEVEAMTKQKVKCEARQTILKQQGDIWADDEIRFLLENTCKSGPSDKNISYWDPLLMSIVVQTGNFRLLDPFISKIKTCQTIITALVIEKHWYPLVWRIENDQVAAFSCGHACGFSVAVNKIHYQVCKQLQKPHTAVRYHCLQFFVDAWCGAMASAYIEHVVWGSPVPTTVKELKVRHQLFREKFRAAIQVVATRPWTWGRGDQPWKRQLMDLLATHGVPQDSTQERASMIVEKLGEMHVIQAMKNKAPWKELKWLATNRVPMIQLIKPSELEEVIRKRVAENKPVGNRQQKKGKGKGKGKANVSNPKMIDPSVLRLETGVFVCNDFDLQQITMEQIGPAASGVALCRQEEAEPFLRSGRQISSGALAIIVVDAVLQPPTTSLMAERTRIPAVCIANSEPILIDGLLFQLGAQAVTRRVLDERMEIVSVSSCVAKFLLFRDQVECPWSTVVAHPLKHLFSLIPLLQACTIDQCDQQRGARHPTHECDIRHPILELWGKQFISHGFSVQPAEKADTFTVHMRLPLSMQDALQQFSGNRGAYVEPKEVDGKLPSGQYQVFWLPRSTHRELVHLRQTVQGICGLARLGTKQGIRCHVHQAEEVHNAIRPDGAYLPQGRKITFLIGPFPYGTLKTSVGQILANLGWAARPLHPIAASSHVSGVMWKLQAVDLPPQSIVQSDQGELLITRLDEPLKEAAPKPNVVAANHTLSLVS